MSGAQRPGLSAVLICHEEVRTIERALESVAFADEIVVVDSGSTDGTLAILEAHPKVRSCHRDFDDYGRQKNFAVDQARHDWVFVIDADEWCTGALQSEILAELAAPRAAGYRMRRDNWFMGRQIRFAWGKDDVLRLFDRRRGRFGERRVHESVEVAGSVLELNERLGHDPYLARGLEGHLAKMDRYSTLSALDRESRTGRVTLWHLLIKPFAAFLKRYLIRRAFLDGVPGLFLASTGAWNVFVRYIKILRLRAGEDLGEPASRAASEPTCS